MIVTPAPLENTIEPFVVNVNRLSPYYTRFQVDIGDGLFVPNTTFQVDDFIRVFPSLPSGLIFDFHLMVQNPLEHAHHVLSLPKKVIGTILMHKAVFPPFETIEKELSGLGVGLVLNPEDGVDSLSEMTLAKIRAVQIMTIVPGFQGQPFIPNMLQKIEQLRKRGFSGEILIDGSVNNKTLPEIVSLAYPPDVLGIGSYLTKSSDVDLASRIQVIKSLLAPGNKS